MLPLGQLSGHVLVSCTLKNILKISCASLDHRKCPIVSSEGPGALSWPSFCSHWTTSCRVGSSPMWDMLSNCFL
jgi:hypothetical protein